MGVPLNNPDVEKLIPVGKVPLVIVKVEPVGVNCVDVYATPAVPAGTVDGPTVTPAPPIETLALFEAVHPLVSTILRVRATVPDTPAVKVTVWLVAPAVIVPPVIVQLYELSPAGPLAVLPVEFGHTDDGAVIEGVAAVQANAP